jgi:hypothetical protein
VLACPVPKMLKQYVRTVPWLLIQIFCCVIGSRSCLATGT